MQISNFQILFFSTILLGTVISISSTSWFGAWVGLELNLMSFIPFVSTKTNQFSSESTLKYFLIQALGSATIVLTSCLIFYYFELAQTLISTALLLKMGAAPFHFWFPQIMEGLSWPDALILMTIQKIAPMILLSYLCNNHSIIMISAVFSGAIGAVGGLNQTLLRSIMAFSSINHMGWMLSALIISESSWIYYFVVYSIMTFSAILLFHSFKVFHLSQITAMSSSNPMSTILLSTTLLSMGGLPPFLGFFPKWLLIQQLSMQSLFFMLFILLLSALGTLYYYLRIITPLLTMVAPKTAWMSTPPYMMMMVLMVVATNILGFFVTFFTYTF
uniref:NADH-ubiquinone oxidoreductase chain 2 n=1 Tax=Jaxea nocturna TaxID=177226 RepID=Q8WGE1_9EUCA|nr:NADH dehydrogenase subunit 2 [Jaxea nocturna]